MKKGISLMMALLLVVGSLSTLAACKKGDDTTPDDEVATQDRIPSGDEDTTKKASGNGTTDGKDPFGGNDQNGSEDTATENSGENEKPLNYTVDSFTDFNEGIVVYQGTITAEDGSQKVGYGYMDSTGKVITPPIYEKACVFYNGLAAVVKGENQKGYIDTTGKEVIPCMYSSITTIMDTLAWVTTTDGVEQMINAKGEVVYTSTGKEVAKGYYQNGLFWVETKEEKLSGNVHTMTYYNEKGEVAFSVENAKHVEAKLGNSNFDSDGYAVVQLKNGVNWWINSDGNIVDHTFTGLAAPSINQREGNVYVIDHSPYYISSDKKTCFSVGSNLLHLGENYYCSLGDPVTKFSGINFLYDFGQGTNKNYLFFKLVEELEGASVMSMTDQKIDGTDAFVLNLHSNSGVGFMAVVDFNGNMLVDPVKAWIGEPIYHDQLVTFLVGYSINPVCAGFMKAQDQDTQLYGYMDMTGTWVIPAQYEKVTDFQGEGDAAIAIVNGNTIINRKGEVLYTINGN